MNTQFIFNSCSENCNGYELICKKHGRDRQATGGYVTRRRKYASCMQDNYQDYSHTLIIFNTDFFYMATVVTRTSLNVTSCVPWPSYNVIVNVMCYTKLQIDTDIHTYIYIRIRAPEDLYVVETTFTGWFFQPRRRVFTVRYELNLYM